MYRIESLSERCRSAVGNAVGALKSEVSRAWTPPQTPDRETFVSEALYCLYEYTVISIYTLRSVGLF